MTDLGLSSFLSGHCAKVFWELLRRSAKKEEEKNEREDFVRRIENKSRRL
jgi:hypothetical protein